MFERILVPLDGSKLAEMALPYAENIAGCLGSEIRIIQVIESAEDPYFHMRRVYLQEIVESTKREAKKYLGKPGSPEIKVESFSPMGDPPWEIIDYADKENIGLIVMVTRGRSGLTRWMIGSVADRVAKTTRIPVVFIRAKGVPLGVQDIEKSGSFHRALVCLDGSKESEAVLPYVEELASKLKIEVMLFEALDKGYYFAKAGGYEYIYHPEKQTESAKSFAQDYLDKIGDHLKQKGITVKSGVRVGDAAYEIINLADEISADVVVMSTHGRSGIARWAMGSVAEKVLHEGSTPLLLVRPPK